MILGLGLGHLGTSADIVLEVPAHVLPRTQTLDQQIGSLVWSSTSLVDYFHHGVSAAAQRPPFAPGYPQLTSLLSVSGIASSSLIDVRRVKALLTVFDR